MDKSHKQSDKQSENVYNYATLTRCVRIPMSSVSSDLQNILVGIIANKLDSKCCAEGFIQPGSIHIISYSSGQIYGDKVEFQIVFECMIANPVEGQKISCVVENITKAGIKCKIDLDISPLVIFIARDHHFMNAYFSSITEGDHVLIEVIGQRYELNDPYISIIANLIESKASHEHKKTYKSKKAKQPITIQENA